MIDLLHPRRLPAFFAWNRNSVPDHAPMRHKLVANSALCRRLTARPLRSGTLIGRVHRGASQLPVQSAVDDDRIALATWLKRRSDLHCSLAFEVYILHHGFSLFARHPQH